jgi:two-component system cell cycle response regulator
MPHEPILIIDDNPGNTKLISFVLSRAGYAVTTAGSAAEALVRLEGELPRLVVMDLQMPGMDGFELTRKLKVEARTRGIIVLAVTAYAMKGDEERALEAGCDGYVTKPIDTRSFPSLVASFLSRDGPGVGT